MAKRLVAKTGEYQNQQGETKGEYTKLGVILSNQSGEYMLLDPVVSLAGILAKQNALAMKKGEQIRDNVMISIFEDENRAQQQVSNQGYQNQPQQGYQQMQQPQQPQNQQPQQPQNQGQRQYDEPPMDFDDDIPF